MIVFSDCTLVVLGIGSNLGERRRIALDAVTALGRVLAELRAASLYETEPLYVTEQGRFINTAVSGLYSGTPQELLFCIHEIEGRFGRDRDREQRWGERTLDIDILLFGELNAALPALGNEAALLEIPHPRLKERRFALEPLLELLPDAVEPGTGLSYRSICQALPCQGVRRLTALSTGAGSS